MMKKCEYCKNDFVSKRMTRKYCSDNCKQMAYLKRNAIPQNELVIEHPTSVIKLMDKKSIQEEILNEIAVKVLQLIDMRQAEQNQNTVQKTICNIEPFSFSLKNKSQK